MADGFRAPEGARHPFPPLRSAACTRPSSARAATTGSFADETFGVSARPRHRPDRRPLPFRRSRLDRQFPEPGLSGAVRRTTPRLSPGAFPGCSSTRRSTRCSSAPTFSAAYGWWNEQLPSDGAFVTALKHIVKANVLAMCTHPQGPARRHLHPERVLGVFPRRESGRDQAGRDHELPPLPVARPQLRPARRFRDVRVPAWTTA